LFTCFWDCTLDTPRKIDWIPWRWEICTSCVSHCRENIMSDELVKERFYKITLKYCCHSWNQFFYSFQIGWVLSHTIKSWYSLLFCMFNTPISKFVDDFTVFVYFSYTAKIILSRNISFCIFFLPVLVTLSLQNLQIIPR